MCLSLTQIHVSTADLVDNTCKQTPNSDLCVSTLHPRSSTADVAGLAIIMVDTIKTKATATLAQINTLLGSNPDPKTKNGLDGCLMILTIKISVNTDISVNEFYENIENIGKISVDIFTKISVIKIFHILII